MKVFLGYASEHVNTAKEVYTYLKTLVEEVWFDKSSLVTGDDWDEERRRGQNAADLVIHLCSAEIYQRSGVVNREIRETLKLAEDQPFGSLYAIFMRLEDMRLPVELSRYHYVDYFQPDWRTKLAKAMDKKREQMRGGAPFVPQGQVVEEELMTNGKVVEFSDTTQMYECVGNYLHYDRNELFWRYVNAEIASHALADFFTFRSDFVLNAPKIDNVPPSSWETTTEEFFARNDLLSIRFYTHYYWAGAAHPNHHITCLNFLGEEHGKIGIIDLLDSNINSANKVLDYCEKVIVASLEASEEFPFFSGYRDSEQSVWSLLSQFNVDHRGITINFSPYQILPYVFGSHEVLVPWRFVEMLLAERFKNLSATLATV